MDISTIFTIIVLTLLTILLLVIIAIAIYIYLTIRDIKKLIKLLSDNNNRKEIAREEIIKIISNRFGFWAPIVGIIFSRYIGGKVRIKK